MFRLLVTSGQLYAMYGAQTPGAPEIFQQNTAHQDRRSRLMTQADIEQSNHVQHKDNHPQEP